MTGCLRTATILLLSERGVSWAWYSGGWSDALAGSADPLFQFHHQPFAYFANYADGTAAKPANLKDERDFFADLQAGALPAVSFVKPIGPDNEHPGYASLLRGQQHVADLVAAVMQSPLWSDTAIVITYDENGGRWDHVAPPVVDRWGPGTRVPTIIVSPFARRGYVDHTLYDTTSILKMIETRWNLEPLTDRDANANDLSNAFDLGQPGVQTVAVKGFMQGHLPASSSGRFAYVTFEYPGDRSVYTIDLNVSPDSAAAPERAGFKVYGPQRGTVYLTGGAQPGLDPNVSGNLVGIDAGTYVVQIYNYSPDVAIDYDLRVTRHPPEGTQP